MFKQIECVLVGLFMFCVVTTAYVSATEEPPSPIARRTKAIVKEAIAYVHAHSDDLSDVQKAFQNDSRFIDRDKGLHIFAHFYDAAKKEAICFGQGMRPKLVGKNMWHLRTPNGRLIVQEIVTMIERDGKGWMEYYWLNPYTKKLQIKISYLEGIVMKDGRKGWVGCGFWKEYRDR